jgi:site-specific recombinase XerD
MSTKYETPPANRALGIHRARKTRILYFRKYVTGVGRLEVSLHTKDLEAAEKLVFQRYSQFVQTPAKKQAAICIDDLIAEIYEINQGKAQATFDDFEVHCRLHILPYFTGRPIDMVARDWPKYVAYQHRKNPNRQLKHDRKHLIRIFHRAVERGDLAGIPILKLDRAKRMRQPISLYTEAEVRLIMGATTKQFPQFKQATLDKIKLQFELTLFSGMRIPTETNALRYSWIDWHRGTATLPGWVTKTREGRTYPVDSETLKKLWAKKLKAHSDQVFPKRGEKDLPASRTDKTWQRFKKAAGITKKRYWARHTHATEAVESGQSSATVTKNMGTSKEMLDRVYVIPTAESFRRQVSAVRRKFIGEIGEGCDNHG